MKLLNKIIGDQWNAFVMLLVLGAISGALYTWCLKIVHDMLASKTGIEDLFLIIGVISVSSLLAVFSGRKMTRLYEHNISVLRVSLSRKVMNADYEQIEGQSSNIVPILMNEVHSLTTFVKSLPAAIVALFQVIGILSYMFWLSWQLTLVVILLFSFIFLFNFSFMSRLHRVDKATRTISHSLHAKVEGMVDGIKELVLNQKHYQTYIDTGIRPKSDEYADKQTELASINVTLAKVSEWQVVVALSLLVFLVGRLDWFSSTDIVNFFTLLLFLLPSIVTVTTFFRSTKRMQVSVEKIEELGVKFDTKVEEQRIVEDFGGDDVQQIIKLDQISYVYQKVNRQFVVGPISLDVKQNEILCITGGNGSGKTTFTKLLTGLYRTSSGSIYFKGQKVDDNHLQTYRNLFAVSFADSYVFQDLSYLKDSSLIEKSSELVEMLEIQDKISIEDFTISDVNLSFGQRGRLNLLRTILEDKPITVFDEWAANQDPYFKDKFYNHILPYLKDLGKTIIMVSHDDNYYHVADRIVKLTEGKISRIMTPADLTV